MGGPTALRLTSRPAPGDPYRASHAQHLVTVAVATWLMVGLFVDGWAHNNLDTSLESFFTPWHALFYSGFTACAGWLAWLVWRGLRQGRPGLAAVPQGYGLAVVGTALFAVGGAGDMTWHLVFGIERDIDALFSPTHLLLFTGIALIVASPFRDAWSAPDAGAPGLRAFLPALASLTLVVSLVGFFFMYWSPYTTWAPTRDIAAYVAGAPADYQESLRYYLVTDGVAAALTATLLFVGPLLLVLRRWRPPAGTATVLVTVPALLSSALEGFARPLLVVAALVAGLVTDVLVRVLRPAPDRRAAVRVVAVLAPMALTAAWFAALAVQVGVWYPPEIWAGTIVWTGLAGLGLALLVLPTPPPGPAPGSAVTGIAPERTAAAAPAPAPRAATEPTSALDG